MEEKKLRFAYLYYTRCPSLGNDAVLMGVFGSSKDAKTHLELVNADWTDIGRSNRVLQKINGVTGQIWYVEKHVLKDPC